MKILPPRLIAAAVLALFATALVINAGPWPSFARFASDYFKRSNNDSKHETKFSSEHLPSSLDEFSLKSGSYFTIYRNDQGEAVCRASTLAEVRQMEVNTRQLRLRPINHPELYSIQGQQEPLSPGSGLTIILRATQQLQENPTAVAAFTRAAQNWEALVMSPVTLYIDVDFGTTFFGQTFPNGVLGATTAPTTSYPYDSVRGNLIGEANGEGNATKEAVVNALPSSTLSTDLGVSSSTVVSDPAARALGLLPATAEASEPAAKIGFNSNFSFDFDPTDGITTGQTDFDAVATHEIGHALGFHSEAGLNLPRPAVLDLYRFRTGTTTGTFTNAQRIVTIGGSPDPLQYFFVPGNSELGLSTGGPNGSFTNGGDGWQSSHWKHATVCSPYIGIMDPAIGSGCRRTITNNDTLALSYFGYNLANSNLPPPPPPTPTPPANDNFANAQVISGCSGAVSGSSFSATSEVGEPSHAPNDSLSLSPNHTVWYQWQAPSSGAVTITTAGSEFDTLLAVYTGGSVGALTRIVFNDDAQSGTLTSSVTLTATGGTVYQIVVDGWRGDAGKIQLNWTGCVVPTPTPTPTPTATPTPTPTPVPCPNEFSGIFTVNSDGDLGDAAPGDGICEASNGLCTLRAAIQEANTLVNCGTININLGGVSGPISLASALPDVNHNINVNGPGANQLTVQRSTQTGTPNFRVFTIGSGRTVAISGLTISNGLVPGGSGGGVLNNGGSLTLSDCSVYGNSVGTTEGFGAGGGIHNAGSLILNNCRIGGTATGQPNTSGANGGGITTLGTLQMNGGLIAGNSESGIYVGGGTATLVGVTVSNNSARNTGGGVRVGAVANLVGCSIANNTATYGGAGVYNGLGTVRLIDSTLSGNTSNQFAGGVYSFNATSTTLINSTVTNNRSTNGNGGGLQNSGGVLLRNSIVAGNFIGATGTTSDDVRDLVSSASAFNLIGSCNSCGLTNGSNNNQVGVSAPGLGLLASNGGATQTHALLSGSPAINAGSNALAVDQNGNPLTTDQRGVGFNRIVNGTVDIGAFELAVAPALLTDAGNHVIAIDSVTFVRDPFSVTGMHNFSSDQRTRVMIFTSNLGVNQPTSDLSVTAGGIPLTVEGVGTLAGAPAISYIIVKLDPTLFGDVLLSITFHSAMSNTGVLSISP